MQLVFIIAMYGLLLIVHLKWWLNGMQFIMIYLNCFLKKPQILFIIYAESNRSGIYLLQTNNAVAGSTVSQIIYDDFFCNWLMIDWIAVSIFHNVCMLVQFLKWYLQADACSDWKFVDFVFFIMSHFYSNSKMYTYLLVLYNPREMEWCRDHTISFFIKIPSHIVSLTARSWKIRGIQTRLLTFNTSIWK